MICFTKQILFPQVDEHHLVFRLREQNHGVEFSEDLEIHLIELPKLKKSVEELTSALDRWCYFLRHGAELDPEQLPASLDVPFETEVLGVTGLAEGEHGERARATLPRQPARRRPSSEDRLRVAGL